MGVERQRALHNVRAAEVRYLLACGWRVSSDGQWFAPEGHKTAAQGAPFKLHVAARIERLTDERQEKNG